MPRNACPPVQSRDFGSREIDEERPVPYAPVNLLDQKHSGSATPSRTGCVEGTILIHRKSSGSAGGRQQFDNSGIVGGGAKLLGRRRLCRGRLCEQREVWAGCEPNQTREGANLVRVACARTNTADPSVGECKRRLKSAAGVTWVTRLGTASGGIFDNLKHVRRYGKLD